MIPDSIAHPPVLTLLDWVISYGPLAVLTVIGGYMLWLGNREISALAGAKTLAGHQELLPDWPIRNLFFYINPDVLDPTPDDEAPWQTLGNSIRDAFALGQLKVWGRRALDSLAPLLGEHTVLVKIEPTYWESAELTYTFFSTMRIAGHRRTFGAPITKRCRSIPTCV
jgi:hypothetical protein